MLQDQNSNSSLWQKLKKKADTYTETGVDILSEVFLDGTIGALVPGASSAIFAYKTKRMEQNLIHLIQELGERLAELQSNYEKMSEENRRLIKEHFSGLICDYVIDEQQEEKIKYFANGFINLTGQENLDFDQTILYLDVLKSLRLIDIQILTDYDYRNNLGKYDQDFKSYLESRGLDIDSYKMIREKLVRLGILKSSYDDEYQKTMKILNELVDFAISLEKGKLKKAPGKSSMSLPKERERIKISNLGVSLIDFFSMNRDADIE